MDKELFYTEEVIASYLNGDMSEDDIIIMEELMAEDPFLKDAVDGLKASLFDANSINTLNSLNDKINEKYVYSGKNVKVLKDRKPNVFNLQLLFKLVSAAAIIILGVFIFNYKSNKTTQKLFAENFTTIDLVPEWTRGDVNSNVEELKAAEQYENKDFEKAAEYYKEVLVENPWDAAHTLYLAICYLNMDNYEKKAIDILSRFNGDMGKYSKEFSWYLAMAYLKDNQRNAARLVLNDLKNDSYYGEQVQLILEKLR